MNYKIVADSSSNAFTLSDVEFTSVPLKIISSEKEYVDTPNLNIEEMVEELKNPNVSASTSCPNVHEWLEAFGNADEVFAVSITSTLSGSYSAALRAKEDYVQNHSEAKVCVLDSLSAGPEIRLIVEKIKECILEKKPFEQIEKIIRSYQKNTHLLFALQSLTNLAKSGRVSPAVAKIAGVLGICVVGKASDEGTLQQLHKCRGEKRALKTIVEEMKKMGFGGKKVRIAHCMNLNAATSLKEMILAHFPSSDVMIESCAALCSYYAEKGGLMIGFEDSHEYVCAQ